MATVILSNEFNESNVTFSEPKKNAKGGSNVLINYTSDSGSRGPLILQTPRLRVPFGADRQEPEGGGATRYSVNLSINSEGTVGKFFNVIQQIEEFVLNSAVENSESWFGKKKSRDVVQELMRSVVKYPKNDKYDPTIKIKLPYNEKGPQFKLEDSTKAPVNIWVDSEIDIKSIPKGSEIICIIQCTGVYFIGKTQFGIGFKVVKARIYESKLLQNIDIIDDDDNGDYEDY